MNHQQSIQISKRKDSLTNRSSQSPAKESNIQFQTSTFPSHRDSSLGGGSNNTVTATIDIEKYKSLELRLMGCMRTIKSLEKEN